MNVNKSLLILNDCCVRQIFQRLGLVDFANLAHTCSKLLNVARSQKFKNIQIDATKTVGNMMSEQELANVLSVIGGQVSEVEVYFNRNGKFMLKSIKESCMNLTSIGVFGYIESQVLDGFRNLKQLIVDTGRYISIDEWRNFFASNPELEVLDIYCYEDGFMELLTDLSKLQSLGLPLLRGCLNQSLDFQHLFQLIGLRKLSLRSFYNLNEILIHLARSMNLIELDVRMKFDAQSFGIINSFENLEFLSIDPMPGWNQEWFLNTTVFPLKLKRLRIHDIQISISTFLEILEHLPLLIEFDLGFKGLLSWNENSKLFYANCILYSGVTFISFWF